MSTSLSVQSPISGRIIPLKDVPDPVFSAGTMGEGLGIADTPGGDIVSPVSGKVMMVAKTGHAIGIATDQKYQFILHLGIDTVELNGEPFNLTVAKGDYVEAGQKIGTMDASAITKAGNSTTTVLAVSNTKKTVDHIDVKEGPAERGQLVAEVFPKQSAASPPSQESSSTEVATSTAQPPAELSGFDATAWSIIHGVGGAENIRSVTHCITRVRLYLKDNTLANDEAVRADDNVIEVVKAGGQYQVVIGPDVEDVHDAVVAQLGGSGESSAAPESAVPRPTTALGWMKFGFSSLIGVITGSMIPVIGLLAASGIIKGVLALLVNFNLTSEDAATYTLINAMSDAVFFFLPIFVGFTAARRLGADQIVVAIVGGVLCYPSLVDISHQEGDHALLGMSLNSDFFGLPYHMASYTYSIFPIIAAAWLASIIEPWLKKVIPNTLRMILLPLVEVVVVSLAVILILGPVVMFISTGIASLIQGLYNLSPTLSGLFIGGFYQSLVIFGLHWAVIPLVTQDISLVGSSPLNAIISATMVAQGGAVLAVFLKSKNQKMKTLAGPAAVSAFCGVTEPAMYGVNLKYGRIFIMGSIGGAVGGLLTGLFNVNMWGFTGSFIGFTSFVNPTGLDFSFWGYWIASLSALVVAFTLTWFFGFTDADIESGREVKKVRLGRRDPVQK
ncbi:PTS beta-glucoside transporter subunit IIABC [Corynebacterium poyangense]|uniref:PTS beta-glucoside transporter subunit IIABC n=1 Tax=Corynebacterium poyangense TaxID=2684405 RepID=A0A7H0SLY6_9CORY|nr:glucose PTS transporter subunit IIA [Corynebacterium poyangense]QNQ89561.1 PTS beta-glucoside transporter subunit IIABC [Corynebacterium poyangense]